MSETKEAGARQRLDFSLMALAEKYPLPEGWEVYSWERVNFDTPAEYIAFSGAVVTKVYTKGPRKGQKNWAKENRSSDMTLPMTFDEIEALRQRWSEKTGICNRCCGSGEEWCGWSAEEGNKYRHCRSCDGTGAARTGGPANG